MNVSSTGSYRKIGKQHSLKSGAMGIKTSSRFKLTPGETDDRTLVADLMQGLY